MRIFLPPTSRQWQLPVTALAAPKKVNFMGHLPVFLCYYSKRFRAGCKGPWLC